MFVLYAIMCFEALVTVAGLAPARHAAGHLQNLDSLAASTCQHCKSSWAIAATHHTFMAVQSVWLAAVAPQLVKVISGSNLGCKDCPHCGVCGL